MQLTPRQPPGRKSRKVLAYASEIRRLRAEGHTNEAIREALADVGVEVSRSTVQREAKRLAVEDIRAPLTASIVGAAKETS